jgi:hypothetical protein
MPTPEAHDLTARIRRLKAARIFVGNARSICAGTNKATRRLHRLRIAISSALSGLKRT